MQTIQKQFVPYEIALAIKELGFNEMCIATFDEDKDFDLQNFEQNYDTFPSHIIAISLWQQCIDWLREEYKINILIVPVFACYQMRISKYDEIEDDNIEVDIDCLDFKDFTSYNECRYEAVLKAIDLCKNK